MNTIPRNLPRFVPTLTEVVEPSSLIRAAPSTSPDVEEIIQSVMQRVDRVLDRRLREDTDAMLRNMMTEQLHTLQLSLRAELALVVQQAVAEAMALPEDEH